MDSLKDEQESSAGFIVTSMRGEIKRRLRKRAKADLLPHHAEG
ncbi:hypothetical protein [Sodalis glossinidius]